MSRGSGSPLERQIVHYARFGVPLAALAGAGVAGLVAGPPAAILVLAGGALVAVIAIFWASLRVLLGETPLSGADAYAIGAPRAEEEQKQAVLRALKDLEFERSVGKISDEDYADLVAKYRAEAKRLLRLLDVDAQPRREHVAALVARHLRRAGLQDDGGVEAPEQGEGAAAGEADGAASEARPAKRRRARAKPPEQERAPEPVERRLGGEAGEAEARQGQAAGAGARPGAGGGRARRGRGDGGGRGCAGARVRGLRHAERRGRGVLQEVRDEVRARRAAGRAGCGGGGLGRRRRERQQEGVVMRWSRYTALAAIASLSMTAAPAAQAQPAAATAAPAQPAAPKAAPAQPAAPKQDAKTAAPSAAKPPTAAAATGSASPAAPSTAAADAGAPAAAGALPPGHPEVGQELPSGHPPVGKPPAGGAASRRAAEELTGLFEVPDDTVQEDAGLPPGAIALTVQDADGQPIPRVAVDVDILQSSVTKGESRERVTRETDDAGTVRLENLTIGGGTSYGISVTRSGGTFSLPHFGLSAEAGKRAVLHVYEATPDVNGLLVGSQGIIYLQLRQDSISVEQLFQVYNLGRVAWLPDETFALPPDYKAFNKSEGMDEMRFEEVKGTGVALRGTVSPGRHEGQFRWQVPLGQEERQTIRIELPPRIAQLRVMAEASKSMTLNVAGFPAAQRTQNRDGKKILITEKAGNRADGGLRTIEITLGGLPTPGVGRWIALVLAGAAVIGGAALNFVRRREADRGPDEEERRELLEARDALLDEFVELERARKRGDVGPKTYDRVRTALLDALARIVSMIESTPARGKTAAGAREPSGARRKADAAASPPP
ncbi:carboxypeptidase-like regulatory domain-containing protein [Sorangium cellulosum]|uniref:carboxypeptidase-like regulatory domain-containing protein n=1 Tax=Sorangium cellulosum TaxID=56 RepID=UPI0003FA1BF1|nr:carboxypeptidase-like regulatory domain-containing protein [Sorangium cellulosum]